jgi:hypothetical protein
MNSFVLELSQEQLQDFMDLVDRDLRQGGLNALPLAVKLVNCLNLAQPLQTGNVTNEEKE